MRIAKIPTPKVMFQTLSILAKHPSATGERARQALWMLQEQGRRTDWSADVLGVAGEPDGIGFGISDAFSFAMKPITVPAKYLWKGTKAVARAVGITHGDATPQAVRMQRLKAAQARTRAAQARARAADSQSEAEYRAAQAFATAADAEAEAADAEATAKEAAMQTAEAEFLPGQATDANADDDQQGSMVDSVFSRLATAKARQLASQDAQTGVRRSPAARAFVAQDFARKILRRRGIAA
jgi:hypothetical protein